MNIKLSEAEALELLIYMDTTGTITLEGVREKVLVELRAHVKRKRDWRTAYMEKWIAERKKK